MDANDPYDWLDDIPAQVQLLAVANALDGDGQAIARATDHRDVDQWVRGTETPVGAETRFGAVIEWLDRISRSGMDPVPVLERLVTLATVEEFDARDAIRALDREQRLRHANEEGRGDRGRPSKVEPLVNATLSTVERMDSANSTGRREAARTALIEDFRAAQPSQATFYRVRRAVLDAGGPDINEMDGLRKTVS